MPSSQNPPDQPTPAPTSARVDEVRFDLRIDAPRDRVWQALTQHTNDWWIPAFRVASADSVIRFDPVPGGQLVETSPTGGGVLWFTVAAVQQGEWITLTGVIAPPFGGPVTTFAHIELEAEPNDATRLRFRDHTVGLVGDDKAAMRDKGWRQLFTEGLKAFVEEVNSQNAHSSSGN